MSSVFHWNNTPRFNYDIEVGNEPIQSVQKNYPPKKQVSGTNEPTKKQINKKPVVNNMGYNDNNNNNNNTSIKPSRYED